MACIYADSVLEKWLKNLDLKNIIKMKDKIKENFRNAVNYSIYGAVKPTIYTYTKKVARLRTMIKNAEKQFKRKVSKPIGFIAEMPFISDKMIQSKYYTELA